MNITGATKAASDKGSYGLRREKALIVIGQFGPLIGLALLCLALALMHDRFLTPQNMINILQQATIIGLVSSGMTVVLVTGGLDLSIGNIISVAGLFGFSMIEKGYGTLAAVVVTLVTGLALGGVNAILILLLGISPLVVTIATSFVFRSLDLVYTHGGSPIYASDTPESFRLIFHGFVGPIPNPIVISIVFFVLFYLLMHRTRYGRFLYATGAQIVVARLSGIRTRLYIALPYVVCGFMGAVGGLLLSSRVLSGHSRAGEAYLFDTIATSFVGATMFKGKPTMIGTVVGALLVAVMGNGLTLMNVNYLYQDLAKGAIFALAVVLSSIQARYR